MSGQCGLCPATPYPVVIPILPEANWPKGDATSKGTPTVNLQGLDHPSPMSRALRPHSGRERGSPWTRSYSKSRK